MEGGRGQAVEGAEGEEGEGSPPAHDAEGVVCNFVRRCLEPIGRRQRGGDCSAHCSSNAAGKGTDLRGRGGRGARGTFWPGKSAPGMIIWGLKRQPSRRTPLRQSCATQDWITRSEAAAKSVMLWSPSMRISGSTTGTMLWAWGCRQG